METVDTYEVEPVATAEVEPDALADFRAQAKAELEEKSARTKMSEAALLKLRAIQAANKLQEQSDERFASALRLIPATDDNLMTLIKRINRSVPVQQLGRRTAKLSWFVQAGYRLGHEIDSQTLLNFFSALVGDEHTMSDARFNNLWSPATAAKLREQRTAHGLIESGIPEYRPCKSGKKCMRFERRKPAAAKGSGEYCSTACAASARARAKRESATLAPTA
jgi:hypothetical protein